MFTKRTIMAALFTIASSLIIVSGGFVVSAFAFMGSTDVSRTIKFDGKDKFGLPAVLSDGLPRSHSTTANTS
jgi:hypothetical protein